MMKVVVALCVLFAVSQAAHMTNWYSGSVNATGTPQAAAVDLTVTTGCQTVTTGATGYQNFTVNVTRAGFFYFSALFEKIFKNSAQLQVYNAPFNPATPCAGLIYAKGGQSDVPHIEFLQYLQPGLYPVVVTGPSAATLGLFAIHVDVATLNGATNELTSPWWSAPTGQSRSYKGTCSASSYPAPYTSFSWAQNGTSTVDILMFGYNSTVTPTSTWYFSAGVYNNTNLAFLGTGNQTNPVSGCNTPYFIYQVSTDYTDLDFNLQNTENYQAAAALGLNLVNGMNYSIVIGTYDSSVFTANFGIFMRPTSLGNLGSTLDFTAPTVPGLSTTTTCTPSSTRYYGVNWFTAQYNAYILDNPQGFFDTAGCLYRGLNIGNATAPPLNCPGNSSHLAFIQCGDTGDGGPVANFLIPGVNYTWIQLPYSGTGTAGAQYLLYNYSGKLLGRAPVTTTGVATTAAMEMSSSSASSVVVMFALYIAAMFF
jgi:hypothetical protein